MSDITKDKLLRLEKVGLEIADNISAEYAKLKSAEAEQQKKVETALSRLSEVSGILEGSQTQGVR